MLNQAYLSSCKLPLATHPIEERWYRIHQRAFNPIFFGPPDDKPPMSRFDDPRSEYRVCYFGLTSYAVVAETLLHSPQRRILSLADLTKRAFAIIQLQREVTLVQLHGPGLNMLDITSDIVDGDYTVCGELARTLYQRSEAVDGLEYRCRHDNGEIAVALFDRAQDALSLESSTPIHAYHPLLINIVERYSISLS